MVSNTHTQKKAHGLQHAHTSMHVQYKPIHTHIRDLDGKLRNNSTLSLFFHLSSWFLLLHQILFLSLHHSPFLSFFLNPPLRHMCIHTQSPHLPLSCQGEEVERQRARPSGSWWVFFPFFFFKGLSGPVVCMADRLDLIPGLIQSLSQLSPAQHVMALLRCPCVYY